MIIGKAPFLAVRISGKYVYGQILKATATGDITICSASSRDLSRKFGWKGSAKSIPGAYLAGLYLGRLAREKGLEDVVVYSGVGRFVHGSRIASLISGAREAGLKIEINEESLPSEERIKGAHISSYSKTLETEDKVAYNKTFSSLMATGLNPADYPSHFQLVKDVISKVESTGTGISSKNDKGS